MFYNPSATKQLQLGDQKLYILSRAVHHMTIDLSLECKFAE